MDLFLFQIINNMAGKNGIIDTIMIFVSIYGMYLLLLAVFLLFFRRKKRYAITGLIGSALALLVNWLISLLYYRNQPFIDYPVNLIVEKGVSPSFPSDSAAIAFACATALILGYRKKGFTILFLISAFLIAYSRVFVGHHYPLDVLSGAVLGVFSTLIVYRLIWNRENLKSHGNPLSE